MYQMASIIPAVVFPARFPPQYSLTLARLLWNFNWLGIGSYRSHAECRSSSAIPSRSSISSSTACGCLLDRSFCISFVLGRFLIAVFLLGSKTQFQKPRGHHLLLLVQTVIPPVGPLFHGKLENDWQNQVRNLHHHLIRRCPLPRLLHQEFRVMLVLRLFLLFLHVAQDSQDVFGQPWGDLVDILIHPCQRFLLREFDGRTPAPNPWA